MEKGNKLLNTLYIIFHCIITLLLGFFIWGVLAETFKNKLCEDISICYAIVLFLVGTALTLKIKILDSEKKPEERILFVVGIALNVFIAILAYYLNVFSNDSNDNNHNAILLLNCLIWIDFFITMRNCYLLIVYYFKKKEEKCVFSKDKAIIATKQDLFKVWLNKKEESLWVRRALTDSTYKNVNHELKEEETNFSLGTYGDAILKMCLSEIFFGQTAQPSKKQEEYGSDKYLVTVVASHYRLLDFIDTGYNNQDMKKDYSFDARKKKNNPQKFIATAVKAMIGAIYKETKDLKSIIELVDSWTRL